MCKYVIYKGKSILSSEAEVKIIKNRIKNKVRHTSDADRSTHNSGTAR